MSSLILNSDAEIRDLLAEVKTIAVLGIKPETHAHQPAFYVPKYMADAGYDVIPVPVYYPEVRKILGREVYRAERDSYKLDLAVRGQYVIELFSFPTPPPRPSQPEAAGLRHLAFAVADLDGAVQRLAAQQVLCEPVRVDELTGRRFTFFSDPDGLPLELYEVA